MKLSRGNKWLLLATTVALVHHIDHVLRVDHSGWPFLPEVTPFTPHAVMTVKIEFTPEVGGGVRA